jgi:hypothetical protein
MSLLRCWNEMAYGYCPLHPTPEVRVIVETPFTERPAVAVPDTSVTMTPDELLRFLGCPPSRLRTVWGEAPRMRRDRVTRGGQD